MWGWNWKWEEKQGGNFSNFWGAALFVTWDCEGLRFPSTYPSIPTQNSLNLFVLFPEFLLPFWTFFLSYQTPSFQWCVKCDWKLNYFSLWHCRPWFPENGWASLLSFPLCLSTCWWLLCSVQCLEQSWLMTFSQGHPFCPPVSSEHSSIGWWQEPQLSVGKPAFQFGPWCLSPTWFWETYLTFLRFQDPQL